MMEEEEEKRNFFLDENERTFDTNATICDTNAIRIVVVWMLPTFSHYILSCSN
jgi:hypothetical protein